MSFLPTILYSTIISVSFLHFPHSFSGWLGASDDPLGYVSRIDQRIEDVTGLSMETAEMLQVCKPMLMTHSWK